MGVRKWLNRTKGRRLGVEDLTKGDESVPVSRLQPIMPIENSMQLPLVQSSFFSENSELMQVQASKQREWTLRAIDEAPFQVWVVVVAGVGFLTDSFGLFCLNFVTPMITYVYCKSLPVVTSLQDREIM